MTNINIATLSAAQLVRVFNIVTTGAPVKKFESQPRALSRTLAEIEKVGLTVEQALERFAFGDAPAPLPAPTVLDLVTGETLPRLTQLHSAVRQVEGDPVKAARQVAKAAVAKGPAEPDDRSPTSASFREMVQRNLSRREATMKELGLIDVASAPANVIGFPAGTFAQSATVADVAAVAPIARKAPRRKSSLHEVPEFAPSAKAAAKAAKVSRAAPAVAADGRGWKRTNATVPQMLAALARPEGVTLAELTAVSGWAAPVEMRHLRKMEMKRNFTLHQEGAGANRRFRAVFAKQA